MALEQMEGFELAGRTVGIQSNSITQSAKRCLQLRVNTVHEKGTIKYAPQESLDDAGGMYPG